jgi:lipid A 4'-phosphatase
VPSDQCDDNCSFPSGHAALGFWAIAFALLAPPRRRKLAVAAAVGFGALIGAVRIAQGAHFLSDVIASGLLVGVVCRLMYYWLLERAELRPGGGAPSCGPAPVPAPVSPPDTTSSR